MQIVSILDKSRKEIMAQAVKVLRQGGVVAHPTDTCYGLATEIYQKKAVEKIAAIKQNEKQKPISVIVGSLSDIEKVAKISPDQLQLMAQYLPGPYTIIVEKRDGCNYQIFERSIGIRIPKNPFCIELVKTLQNPITTTSANITGNPVLYSAKDVYNEFLNEKYTPDLIVDFGDIPKNSPSKIMDIRNEGEIWLR